MLAIALAFAVAFMICSNAFSHGGGVDRDGCHVDKSNGKRHCHGSRTTDKRFSVCAEKVPAPGDDNVIYGRVVSVTDGDTFKAKIQGAVMEFRMADVDAPEVGQPYGREAHAMLSAALDGKEVVMLRVDTDAYGRLVVHVWIASLQINREMVARGAAWFYPEYAHDNCLYNVENEARDSLQGLWALAPKSRVEPWVWRAHERARNK